MGKRYFMPAVLFFVLISAGYPAEPVRSAVEANNRFAFDLYRAAAAETGGDIFFSPWSIFGAFALLYEGAGGRTLEQLGAVFYFPRREILRKEYEELSSGLSGGPFLSADNLWTDRTYPFLRDYKDVCSRHYGADIRELDFVHQPEKSRKTINRFIEKTTRGKIRDLLPEDSVKNTTALVLTNAVYFKGDWVVEFDKKLTEQEPFYLLSGSTRSVEMMSLSGEKALFPYWENDMLQAVELPYKGDEYSMLVLLPKDRRGLPVLEKSLDPVLLSEITGNMKRENLKLFLPKFHLETKYDLKSLLIAMGLTEPFSSYAADFTAMSANNDLYVSDAFHKAYVDVYEEGTEAAAATGIIIGRKSIAPPVIEFRADHPFVFIIRHRETGAVLFLGRYTGG